MNVVYKYFLNVLSGDNIISMPQGATVISVGNQRENLVLWAVINPEIKLYDNRTFRCVLTGQVTDLPGYIFLDTVLFDKGNFVVHCFEYVE